MTLEIQGTKIFDAGKPLQFSRSQLSLLLKQDTIKILIDFQSGEHSATAWGCDLSKKYVDINAEYST